MDKELTCKPALAAGIIDKDVFERELALCAQLSKEGTAGTGKCGWGICKNCGVLPLLYKLHKGQLIEDPDLIIDIKKNHNINLN